MQREERTELLTHDAVPMSDGLRLQTSDGRSILLPAPVFSDIAIAGESPPRGGPAERTTWLVVFLPFAFSPVCTSEVAELQRHASALRSAGIRLVAVTCDPITALKVWGEQEGLSFELASDFWPHGLVSEAFGVFDAAAGRPGRSSFLVGHDGQVLWEIHRPPGQPRPWQEYRAAFTSLGMW